MKKALMLAAVVAIAACSRNPEPGVEETGRADTTTMGDTTVKTPSVDTSAQRDTTTYGRDTTTMDTTAVQPDTSMVGRDTAGYVDTTTTAPDSARVPHETEQFEGDTALIERNVPDTTQNQPQPQQ